jgi:hypothetical protein
MMAICPAGPPKLMKPSLTQKRNASAKETLRPAVRVSPSGLGLGPLPRATAGLLSAAILPPFILRSVLAEQCVQAVEHGARLPEELAVVPEQFSEAAHDAVQTRRLEPVELVVLQVDVVNDLGQLAQGRVVAEAETLD